MAMDDHLRPLGIEGDINSAVIHKLFLQYAPGLHMPGPPLSDIKSIVKLLEKIGSASRGANVSLNDWLRIDAEELAAAYERDDQEALVVFLRLVLEETCLFQAPTVFEKDAKFIRLWNTNGSGNYPSMNLVFPDTKQLISNSHTSHSAVAMLVQYAFPQLLDYSWPRAFWGMREGTKKENQSKNVKAFSWHKHKNEFAVVNNVDTLRMFDCNAGAWASVELKHEFQREVQCMAWQPMSSNIAVGCKHGICLWELKNKEWWMTFMASHQSDITSLSFSPCGSFVASTAGSGFSIYDLATRSSVVMLQNHKVSMVCWSPNGLFVLALLPTVGFRIFESMSWKSEIWYDSNINTGVWAPSSKDILVTSLSDATSALYVVHLPHAPPVIEGVLIPVTLDLSVASTVVDFSQRPFAPIRSIAIDPTCNRLAVVFQDTVGVACYSVSSDFSNLFFLGHIFGRPGFVAEDAEFKPKFEGGALLSVVFTSETEAMNQLRHVPLYF